MKPTKETLIEELEDRVKQATKAMEPDNNILNDILAFEISHIQEIISLVRYFGNKTGYEKFEISKYTPIKDYHTKEPLLIGDLVATPDKKACGTLYFEEIFNRYVIRSATGGNHYTTSFIKIDKIFDYSLDNTKVECRPNPNKIKW